MNILLWLIPTVLSVMLVNGHNIETTLTRCDQVTCTLSEVCSVYEVYDMSCLCPNGRPQRALGEDYVDSNGQKFPGPNICPETCTETVVRAVCDPIDRPCSTHAATCSSDQLCLDTKLKAHHCTNNWIDANRQLDAEGRAWTCTEVTTGLCVADSGPTTTQPPGGWNKEPSELNTVEVAEIKSACDNRDCTKQPEVIKKTRSEVVVATAKLLGDGVAETRASKTFQAKVALFNRDALGSFVVPFDDGTYSGVLLTEKQADRIIMDMNTDPNIPRDGGLSKFAPPPAPSRARRNAIFFPEDIALMWDVETPIEYMVESTFSTDQVVMVERALSDISHKSCVQFKKVTQKPAGSYIEYVKADNAGFCGLSWLGRVEPHNTVWINFETAGCKENVRSPRVCS